MTVPDAAPQPSEMLLAVTPVTDGLPGAPGTVGFGLVPLVVPVTAALRGPSPTELYAPTVYVCVVFAPRPLIVADVPVTVARTVVPSYTR